MCPLTIGYKRAAGFSSHSIIHSSIESHNNNQSGINEVQYIFFLKVLIFELDESPEQVLFYLKAMVRRCA